MKTLKFFGVLVILAGLVILIIGAYNYWDYSSRIENASNSYGVLGELVGTYALKDNIKDAKTAMISGGIITGVGIFIIILGNALDAKRVSDCKDYLNEQYTVGNPVQIQYPNKSNKNDSEDSRKEK